MEQDNKQRIQSQIQKTGKYEEIERCPAVAHGSQEPDAAVVGNGGEHSDENDDNVQIRLIEHICRRQQGANAQIQLDHGRCSPAEQFFISAAKETGQDNYVISKYP